MRSRFVFVAQGGPIEPQAALLAASLRQNINCEAEIIAAIPQDNEVHAPSSQMLDFLDDLAIIKIPISNTVDRNYPIANKIMCFEIPFKGEFHVFLDSDILCVNTINEDFFDSRGQFAARLTDFSDLDAAEWEEIFDYVEMPRPVFDHRSMISNAPMPLCFNSGLVICEDPLALYEKWSYYANEINDVNKFPKVRPFLDQITLPMAVTALGLNFTYLNQEEHLSSPIIPIHRFHLPFFAHYYENIHLLGDHFLAMFAEKLIVRFEKLRPILARDPLLKFLIDPVLIR